MAAVVKDGMWAEVADVVFRLLAGKYPQAHHFLQMFLGTFAAQLRDAQQTVGREISKRRIEIP